MTTKLSKDGYKIIKKEYGSKFIKEIKDELTVKPFNSFNKAQMNSDVGRFSVYLESPKKLYLPRFFLSIKVFCLFGCLQKEPR